MAAGVLQEPGTKFGPCVECKHRDCAAARATAAALCGICGEAIGYDKAFYRGTLTDNENGWSHAVCLETAAESAPA